MEGRALFEMLGGLPPLIDGERIYSLPVRSLILKKIYPHTKVLARCTPEHKLAFLLAIQSVEGCSVAYTGDGLNDVAALKQANVSFCMGVSGCEVAKDAASIIILDDNFNSVYNAVLWGRNILQNVRKFLQFQLCVNIVCVSFVFIGGATLGNSPFSVTQLLWVNMIMDTFAAIAIATEPPSKEFKDLNLDDKSSKYDKIIQPVMWRNILVQAAY